MSRGIQAERVRRSYEFIKANQQKHNVRMMCRALDVTRSGCYAWLMNIVSNGSVLQKDYWVARADNSNYIESFYNRMRRHRPIGGVSPEMFEQAAKRH